MMSWISRLSLAACGLLLVPLGGAAPQASDWVAPERAAKRANPVLATPAEVAKGKAIYLKSCQSCHGPSGDGDGPKAKYLAKKPHPLLPDLKSQSDGALFWKITSGRKLMPSFDSELAPDQVWSLVNYLRTLKATD